MKILLALRVRTRLWLLGGVALLGMLSLTLLALSVQRQSMLKDRMGKVRSQVETAAGVIGHFQQLEQEGRLDREQAQLAAIAALRQVRYDKSEYFFIFDTRQVYKLMPTKPEFEGQSKGDLKDSNGKLILQALSAAARAGGGFVDYDFVKLGSDKPEPKISYATLVPGWDWVIGTGVYVDDINRAFRQNLLIGVGQLLLLGVLIGGVAWLVARSILYQLGGEPAQAMHIMHQVAAGDLRQDMPVAPAGSLLASLAQMNTGLRQLIGEVRDDAALLQRQAGEIATSSREVSIAAGRQADATSSMAAAMEELTVSINHISDSSAVTEQASRQATALARTGVGQVADASQAMEHIAGCVSQASEQIRLLNSKAQEVSGIAAVIKDIAGQTNLLALNAAIEAARAGEQGRGFAVVADEVRKLAERTATATVNIEQVLASIQTDTLAVVGVMDAALPQVSQGVELARSVSGSLERIHAGADETLSHLHEVASATREQSLASTSIAARVEDVSQMVEETSCAISQTAENAAQVEHIAGRLNDLVRRFRV
ncbi:methyl-accepting chemotaxis protein [Chitinilyticum piscinae]|uniref:Cache domain-containing protein n=1 Tax=Chitinilyticum piscinae TaxID=2866724 RepID=A0A8J7FLK7_9NEIS|nr:methyl-accepting chemotaxis protein [Chitinilyticum piscinae]MBE9610322.1 cache domain-containing protein [Chitinilyticum piscinae]